MELNESVSNTSYLNIYFISLYVRDANGTDISISADPMKLKQGEAYIRDSILKLDAGHQFYITVTGPIDYYIVTTP